MRNWFQTLLSNATCTATTRCFDASRYSFLNSDVCVCDEGRAGALFSTFCYPTQSHFSLLTLFCSQNTVQLMTAGTTVHVTNLAPPGSECNPGRGSGALCAADGRDPGGVRGVGGGGGAAAVRGHRHAVAAAGQPSRQETQRRRGGAHDI
jgi:hypothetical protein